jgi:hypothetical protein
MPARLSALVMLLLSGALIAPAAAQAPAPSSWDPLTGPRSRLARDWVGSRFLPADTEILVMAGHADSQGIAGAGTRGEAVARFGARPMQPGITDELHWNLLTVEAIARLGRERGLRIRTYDPGVRSIASGDDPRTTWSVGRNHVAAGGYALEIHYDAYGHDGVGSGLIAPLQQAPSRIDESLAREFGNYPLLFREGLGAPRRGVAILEIGKLEGTLERSLRDPGSRDLALSAIAERVVQALARGLEPPPEPIAASTATAATASAVANSPAATAPAAP